VNQIILTRLITAERGARDMDPLTGKIQVMNQIAPERQFLLKVKDLQSVDRKIEECAGLR